MPKATADEYISFVSKAYDFVTKPLPIFGSAKDIAEKYSKADKTVHENVDNLIQWHCTKTAVGGFITGLGGLITMPITIPADIAQSIYIQLRMIGAIAHLYDYDLESEQVKIMTGVCLCGNQATEIIKKAGIELIGKQLLKKSLSTKVIQAINKAVGIKLMTKFGSKSAVTFGKAVPLLGGFVGGSFNYFSTLAIGKAAKTMFR